MADLQEKLWNAFRRQPSEATFGPLYEATRALVYTLSRRILRDEEDAQDAFQAVYCRLLELARGGGKARGDAPVENIVYRLAVREADNLRKRRRRRSLKEVAMDAAYLPGSQPTPERIAADRQLREVVERLVEALPERYRLPLQLHYFHGRSHAEVARILGRPTGTVSVYISRALRRLDPLLRRAGLQHAPVVLGAFVAGAQLLSPPPAFSAPVVFANAKAAALAGGTITAAASAASTSTRIAAGVALMKAKAVTISVAVALAALALFTYEVTREPPPQAPAQAARAPAVAAAPVGEPPGVENVAEVAVAPESPGAPSATGATESRPVLRGIVVDALTEEPIAGAKVWRKSGPGGWPSVVTGEDGRFEIRAAEPGRYELQAWSRTHVASTKRVTLGDRGEQHCRFELEPGFEVDVLVVDQDDRPIEGARVYGQPEIFNQDTDSDGRARVGAVRRDGRHDLYASKDGYGFAGAFQPVFEPGESVGHVTIVLESRAAVVYGVFQGRVIDADGKPIAGADVTWGWPSSRSLLMLPDKTKTDEDGDYHLEVHEEREGPLSVMADGFALAWTEHPPPGTPAEPSAVDFSLTAGHMIDGLVVGADDEPLAGAEVCVYAGLGDGRVRELPRTGRPKTGADGRFSFEHLPGPRVQLAVRGPGATWDDLKGWSLFEQWFGVDTSVRVVLEREGVIRLRVVEESGEAIPSFLLRHTGKWHDDWAVGDTVNDDEGRFVLPGLTQGKEYELKVEAEGFLPRRQAGVKAVAREEAEEILFELTRGAALEGVVVDAETGAPIEGAEVLYGVSRSNRMWLSWSNLSDSSQIDNAQKVRSDAKGTFMIQEGDRPGILLIRAGSYERKIVTPDDRRELQIGLRLRIPLSGGASLSGAFLWRGEPQPGARVQLRRTGGRSQLLTPAVTDEAGRYRWEGLAPGTYELYTEVGRAPNRGGGAYFRRKIELAAGEEKTVDLGGDMGPWSLAGRVREGEEPLYQIKVRLKARFPWDYEQLELFTDAAGRFEFDGLEEGEYELQAVRWDPTFRHIRETLRIASDMEHDLEFAAVHGVTGRLRFPESVAPQTISMLEEIHLVAVEQDRFEQDNPDQISGSASATLDGDTFEIPGRFRGEYRLFLSYRSGEDLVRIGFPRSLRIDNLGDDVELGEIPAPALGALRARITPAPPGTPRPNTIWLFLFQPGAEDRLSSVVVRSKNPEVSVAAINVGAYLIEGSALAFRGAPRRVPVTIVPGKEAVVDLTLRPTGVVAGQLTDASVPEKEVRPRRVTLVGQGTRRVLESGKSAATRGQTDRLKDNWYSFSDLKKGTYRVRVEADGYRALEYSIEVTPGLYEQPRTIELEPER